MQSALSTSDPRVAIAAIQRRCGLGGGGGDAGAGAGPAAGAAGPAMVEGVLGMLGDVGVSRAQAAAWILQRTLQDMKRLLQSAAGTEEEDEQGDGEEGEEEEEEEEGRKGEGTREADVMGTRHARQEGGRRGVDAGCERRARPGAGETAPAIEPAATCIDGDGMALDFAGDVVPMVLEEGVEEGEEPGAVGRARPRPSGSLCGSSAPPSPPRPCGSSSSPRSSSALRAARLRSAPDPDAPARLDPDALASLLVDRLLAYASLRLLRGPSLWALSALRPPPARALRAAAADPDLFARLPARLRREAWARDQALLQQTVVPLSRDYGREMATRLRGLDLDPFRVEEEEEEDVVGAGKEAGGRGGWVALDAWETTNDVGKEYERTDRLPLDQPEKDCDSPRRQRPLALARLLSEPPTASLLRPRRRPSLPPRALRWGSAALRALVDVVGDSGSVYRGVLRALGALVAGNPEDDAGGVRGGGGQAGPRGAAERGEDAGGGGSEGQRRGNADAPPGGHDPHLRHSLSPATVPIAADRPPAPSGSPRTVAHPSGLAPPSAGPISGDPPGAPAGSSPLTSTLQPGPPPTPVLSPLPPPCPSSMPFPEDLALCTLRGQLPAALAESARARARAVARADPRAALVECLERCLARGGMTGGDWERIVATVRDAKLAVGLSSATSDEGALENEGEGAGKGQGQGRSGAGGPGRGCAPDPHGMGHGGPGPGGAHALSSPEPGSVRPSSPASALEAAPVPTPPPSPPRSPLTTRRHPLSPPLAAPAPSAILDESSVGRPGSTPSEPPATAAADVAALLRAPAFFALALSDARAAIRRWAAEEGKEQEGGEGTGGSPLPDRVAGDLSVLAFALAARPLRRAAVVGPAAAGSVAVEPDARALAACARTLREEERAFLRAVRDVASPSPSPSPPPPPSGFGSPSRPLSRSGTAFGGRARPHARLARDSQTPEARACFLRGLRRSELARRLAATCALEMLQDAQRIVEAGRKDDPQFGGNGEALLAPPCRLLESLALGVGTVGVSPPAPGSPGWPNGAPDAPSRHDRSEAGCETGEEERSGPASVPADPALGRAAEGTFMEAHPSGHEPGPPPAAPPSGHETEPAPSALPSGRDPETAPPLPSPLASPADPLPHSPLASPADPPPPAPVPDARPPPPAPPAPPAPPSDARLTAECASLALTLAGRMTSLRALGLAPVGGQLWRAGAESLLVPLVDADTAAHEETLRLLLDASDELSPRALGDTLAKTIRFSRASRKRHKKAQLDAQRPAGGWVAPEAPDPLGVGDALSGGQAGSGGEEGSGDGDGAEEAGRGGHIDSDLQEVGGGIWDHRDHGRDDWEARGRWGQADDDAGGVEGPNPTSGPSPPRSPDPLWESRGRWGDATPSRFDDAWGDRETARYRSPTSMSRSSWNDADRDEGGDADRSPRGRLGAEARAKRRAEERDEEEEGGRGRGWGPGARSGSAGEDALHPGGPVGPVSDSSRSSASRSSSSPPRYSPPPSHVSTLSHTPSSAFRSSFSGSSRFRPLSSHRPQSSLGGVSFGWGGHAGDVGGAAPAVGAAVSDGVRATYALFLTRARGLSPETAPALFAYLDATS